MSKSEKRPSKGKPAKVKRKCLDETETLTYEQEILDNNRQLARLRSRNQELEEEALKVREKFRQLEDDRSDVILFLKRDLEEKVEETKVLTEQLSALEEKRKDELAEYKKREEQMHIEFRTMENNLSAEAKLAAGKLSALEDWRLARIDLMQKLKTQESEMEEQERRHKEALYEAEKSGVIGKFVMKKEIEERLKALAEAFRKAINLRVAETTHRAIRENIALNDEFDKVLQTCKDFEAMSEEWKEAERISRLQSEMFETEAKIAFKRAMDRREDIHTLANDFQLLIDRYEEAQSNNVRMAALESIVLHSTERNEQMKKKIQTLQQCILKAKDEKEELLSDVREKEEELNGLRDIMLSTKNCLEEALQVRGPGCDCYCAKHIKNKLLKSLWNILGNDSIISIVRHTASQIDNVRCSKAKKCFCIIDYIQPSKSETKDQGKEQEEDTQEHTHETAPTSQDVVERRPSCLTSEISSNIPSPKESTDLVKNH